MEHNTQRRQAVDSHHRQHLDFKSDLKGKYRYYRAKPVKALVSARNHELWLIDQKWAIIALSEVVSHELASSIFETYVKKWEKFVLTNGASRTANIWLRKLIEKIHNSAKQFPVPIDELYFESGRIAHAQLWADKCVTAVHECIAHRMTIVATKQIVVDIAKQWSFVVKDSTQVIERIDGETDDQFKAREANEQAWLSIPRLLDDKWWKLQINRSFSQFYEHCQIINGRVHKGASRYLSANGLNNFRSRKVNAQLAMSKLIAINNDTGQEIEMLDVIKGSVANPELRRKELMCRLRGCEESADENGLVGGFFTLTAPSKYHAYAAHKNGSGASPNSKYKGASPKITQQYLCKVWSRARAKLKRLKITIMGFRVCEPHHDGTPHWHALFFFKPEHENIIRYVLADYFTQENREELGVNDDDFLLWNKIISADKVTDSESHIERVLDRISPRFDYKKVDKKKGSATGYLAKYISKNIDGYNVDNGEGTPAEKLAELACGWASTWGIRQFQQIGGPPVSVWRELRRLEQNKEVLEAKAKALEAGEKYIPKITSLIELQATHDSLEVARIAADLGNWAMYIEAMGGIFCTRENFPITMVYKSVDNLYGEIVKKLKALGSFNKTMITRTDNWSIVKKGAERDGFDLERSDSSALGVLSITVRGEKTVSVEHPLIEQAGQLGVIICEFEAQILSAGGRITLSNRIVGEERHIESIRLVETSLNRGSDLLEINHEVKKRVNKK